MRLSKTFPMDDPASSRVATVRELTPTHVRNLLAGGDEAATKLLEDVVKGNLSGLAGLLGDCVELPCKVEDLSYSEIETIKAVFLEVNQAFFTLAAMAGGVLLQLLLSASRISTAPAADLSNAATPT